MAIQSHKCGSSTIARIWDADGLRELLTGPGFDSQTIIVKPNWVSTEPADFTDAKMLRTLFEALDAQFVVVESSNLLRHTRGMKFKVGDQEVDWSWLLKGPGWNWLIENPGWEWFREGGHWQRLQQEEQHFLEKQGFSDLFAEFGVRFVNVTDEVWNGRIADPALVSRAVEGRFKALQTEAFYSMVPAKLFDLRGATFISLAKLKSYASFTFKNMFGMISDPAQPYWHGPHNARIGQSIVDINKIYAALFNMFGVCEGMVERSVPHAQGEYQGLYMGKYTIVGDTGLVAYGPDLVALDTLLLALTEGTSEVVEQINRDPLKLAEMAFGAVDREAIGEALGMVGDWFSTAPIKTAVGGSHVVES